MTPDDHDTLTRLAEIVKQVAVANITLADALLSFESRLERLELIAASRSGYAEPSEN